MLSWQGIPQIGPYCLLERTAETQKLEVKHRIPWWLRQCMALELRWHTWTVADRGIPGSPVWCTWGFNAEKEWWTEMRANASSYQQAGHLDRGSSETKLLPLSAVALSTGSRDLLIPVRPCFLASSEFFAVIDMTGFHWLWKGKVCRGGTRWFSFWRPQWQTGKGSWPVSQVCTPCSTPCSIPSGRMRKEKS